jgi:hypothetical protein
MGIGRKRDVHKEKEGIEVAHTEGRKRGITYRRKEERCFTQEEGIYVVFQR